MSPATRGGNWHRSCRHAPVPVAVASQGPFPRPLFMRLSPLAKKGAESEGLQCTSDSHDFTNQEGAKGLIGGLNGSLEGLNGAGRCLLSQRES